MLLTKRIKKKVNVPERDFDIDDCIAFACGFKGLTPSEFYNLSWYEYDCMVDGNNKKIRDEWERTLWITYCSMRGNVNIPEGDRSIGFNDYVASILDGVDHNINITMEELERVKKLWGID